jgi:hypothetical protein
MNESGPPFFFEQVDRLAILQATVKQVKTGGWADFFKQNQADNTGSGRILKKFIVSKILP